MISGLKALDSNTGNARGQFDQTHLGLSFIQVVNLIHYERLLASDERLIFLTIGRTRPASKDIDEMPPIIAEAR
jgi:hypothetical protein